MSATTTKTRKAKGRGLQKKIRDLIVKLRPDLDAADIVSTTMGDTGEDIKFFGTARHEIPFVIECKKNAKFAIYAQYEQAQSHAKKLEKQGLYKEPLLIIEGDHKPALAVINLEWLLREILCH